MTGATNWAGNVTYGAVGISRPSSVEELRRLVASQECVRALGTGHSFNAMADSPGELVSTLSLPSTVDLDAERRTVTVAAGVRYAHLTEYLHGAGYALGNLASLPHISVGGACQTATHGSGDGNGNLATQVSAVRLVTADGGLLTVYRGMADFPGVVVGLGAVGVITSLTLDVVPAFSVAQYVYHDLPRAQLDRRLDEVFGNGYSVSVFTDWTGSRMNQVWLKRRVGEHNELPRRWFGATLADRACHPIATMPAATCTEQLGVPGPWHLRLPHFRSEYLPSSGQELQSEYFVPRDRAVEALAALDEVRDRIAPVLQISEIRTVAADGLWLSPSYRRASVAIHFTWVPDVPAVSAVLAAIEERLAPFEARPHWGKLFGVEPDVLRRRYPRFPDYLRLLRRHDPAGKFRNEFIDRYAPR